ncbi:MAG: replication initiator protein A, partial [Lachnospiraceae bacterium]|nr:replication initiator protein A [Lachnospiraceae bacterium]
MNSDYLQKEKTEKYSFFPVPKMMVMDKEFIKISAEAKLLFGLMLDRLSLSRKNGWLDENGNVFIYFTIEDVRYFLRCSATKAVSVLKELTTVNLIDCRRVGLGKPNMIYIKDFTRCQKTEFKNSE